MIINYSEKGKAYRDCDIEAELLDSYASGIQQIETSTDNIIYAARTLVAEEKLPYQNIIFKYNDKLIKVDKYGHVEYYPKGFHDQFEKYINRLLDAKYTEEKKNGWVVDYEKSQTTIKCEHCGRGSERCGGCSLEYTKEKI